MKRLRPKLTFANVVSCLALFVALGSGAYAATQLPKNSVGTKQLKKGAVTGAKIKKGSLLASNFKADQLPMGKEGPPGPKGDPGATNVVARYGPEVKLASGGSSSSFASCNPGEPVTGGGYQALEGTTSSEFHLTRNRPGLPVGEEFPPPGDGSAATGWLVSIENNTGNEIKFRAYVMCASP